MQEWRYRSFSPGGTALECGQLEFIGLLLRFIRSSCNGLNGSNMRRMLNEMRLQDVQVMSEG